MTSGETFLQSLLEIILSSAKIIEADRAERGLGDMSLFDELLSQSFVPSKEVFYASQSLVGAANMLAAVFTDPEVYMKNLAMGYLNQAALKTVIDAHIADIIPVNKVGISATKISEKTGIEKSKLVRTLRSLCNHFIFRELQPEVFAHTNFSKTLLSQSHLPSFLSHCVDEVSRASRELNTALLNPEYSFSFSPEKTPLSLANGISKTYFEWINLAGNEGKRKRFNRAMQGLGEKSLASLPVVYPWNSVKTGGIIVDVGGGTGHACMQLLKTHRHLKYIIQDLPSALIDTEKYWHSECPEELKSGKVELQAHDFFTVNAVKQADVYFLRHIIHDWPNDKAVEILKNIQVSMGPDSRVVLSENILVSPVRLPDTRAPWPLLGNYGSRFATHLDLQMLVLLNGKERTVNEFHDLLEESGLKLVEVIEPLHEASGALIVGMKAFDP